MTFSGCGSHHKDTCDYDEYISGVPEKTQQI